MTTDRSETGQNSVKVTVNAKGEAQVEAKVYALPMPDSDAPKPGVGGSPSPANDAILMRWDECMRIAKLVAFTKDKIESEIRKNGGRVAGDAVKA
jgi:hypothetical protein